MKYIKIVLWIVIIAIIILVVKQNVLDKYKKTDVTQFRNATKAQLESELGVTCSSASQLSDKVYHYSKNGVVTVEGDTSSGIGVVYLNGFQSGLVVADAKYELYGIPIGKTRVGMDSSITFQYEEKFEIDEGVENEIQGDRKEFAVFYCNWTNNDCVVVTCEKSTGIVEAVTYFNDAKKVTEQLAISGKK